MMTSQVTWVGPACLIFTPKSGGPRDHEKTRGTRFHTAGSTGNPGSLNKKQNTSQLVPPTTW